MTQLVGDHLVGIGILIYFYQISTQVQQVLLFSLILHSLVPLSLGMLDTHFWTLIVLMLCMRNFEIGKETRFRFWFLHHKVAILLGQNEFSKTSKGKMGWQCITKLGWLPKGFSKKGGQITKRPLPLKPVQKPLGSSQCLLLLKVSNFSNGS